MPAKVFRDTPTEAVMFLSTRTPTPPTSPTIIYASDPKVQMPAAWLEVGAGNRELGDAKLQSRMNYRVQRPSQAGFATTTIWPPVPPFSTIFITVIPD